MPPSGPPPFRAPVTEPPGSEASSGAPADKVSVLAALRFAVGVGLNHIGTAVVLLFVPLVGSVAMMGWSAEIHQRLVARKTPEVVEFRFGDLGRYIQLGLPAFLSRMLVGGLVTVPTVFVVGIAFGLVSVAGEQSLLVALIGFGAVCALVVLSLAATVLTVALRTRAEILATIDGTFRLPETIRYLQRNWLAILVHHLVMGVVAVAAVFAGFFALCVGAYVASAVLQFAFLHLRWQLYELHRARGGEAIVEPAPAPTQF